MKGTRIRSTRFSTYSWSIVTLFCYNYWWGIPLRSIEEEEELTRIADTQGIAIHFKLAIPFSLISFLEVHYLKLQEGKGILPISHQYCLIILHNFHNLNFLKLINYQLIEVFKRHPFKILPDLQKEDKNLRQLWKKVFQFLWPVKKRFTKMIFLRYYQSWTKKTIDWENS